MLLPIASVAGIKAFQNRHQIAERIRGTFDDVKDRVMTKFDRGNRRGDKRDQASSDLAQEEAVQDVRIGGRNYRMDISRIVAPIQRRVRALAQADEEAQEDLQKLQEAVAELTAAVAELQQGTAGVFNGVDASWEQVATIAGSLIEAINADDPVHNPDSLRYASVIEAALAGLTLDANTERMGSVVVALLKAHAHYDGSNLSSVYTNDSKTDSESSTLTTLTAAA